MPEVTLFPGTRIAEALAEAGRRLGDDRIARVLLPGDQVRAARQALHLMQRMEARNTSVQNMEPITLRDHAAGEAAILIRAAGRRCQGNRQFLPVHEIRADGMSPVHRAPEGAVRVVLVEEVILP